MTNVLLTGGRAPVTLDLARHFASHQCNVYVADSLTPFICSRSNAVKQSFVIPSPRRNLDQFTAALIDIIEKKNIDVLIPTCEEVFFISMIREQLVKHCSVFADSLSTLSVLHNKLSFAQLTNSLSIQTPETVACGSEMLRTIDTSTMVFKPAFSRFASRTLIKPSRQTVEDNVLRSSDTWIAQRFVKGQELCSYSVAQNGEIVAHVTYPSAVKIGKGSCAYFESVIEDRIQVFVQEVVRHFSYTGQIAFDFIKDEGGEMHVLECNPRATSGIHLLVQENDFFQCFLSQENPKPIAPIHPSPRTVKIPALMVTIKRLICFQPQSYQLLKKVSKAKDVIFSRKDASPSFFQFYIIFFFVIRGWIRRMSPLALSTEDIEWNGDAS